MCNFQLFLSLSLSLNCLVSLSIKSFLSQLKTLKLHLNVSKCHSTVYKRYSNVSKHHSNVSKHHSNVSKHHSNVSKRLVNVIFAVAEQSRCTERPESTDVATHTSVFADGRNSRRPLTPTKTENVTSKFTGVVPQKVSEITTR